MDLPINYLAVLVSSVISMVLGMLWYSPLLFGKKWMSLMGISDEQMKQAKTGGMGKTYGISFLATLLMAYVLAHFVFVWHTTGIIGAWQLALWSWLGFVAPVMLSSVLWEKKPVSLYLINSLFQLASLFTMALILSSWMTYSV